MHPPPTPGRELSSYLKPFALAYTGCILAVAALSMLLDANLGGSTNIASLMAGAAFAVQKFVSGERRLPSRQERVRFAVRATAVAWLVSLLLMALIFGAFAVAMASNDMLGLLLEIPRFVAEYWHIAIVVSVVVTLLYFAVLCGVTGFMAKMFLEAD